MRDIVFTADVATSDDTRQAEEGINAAALALGKPIIVSQDFALQARHGEELVGDLNGKVFWDWLYIDLLWVRTQDQRRGIGTQLMKRAETTARSKNMTGIYLWTQDWQAEAFYKKLGYAEFTRFDDFPRGHQRIGLRKYL